MTHIIVKKDISHFNRAMGIQINSRKQYKDEMRKRGLVSQEKGDDMARIAKEKSHKDYKASPDTIHFLNEVKSHSKDGKVKLSGRELAHMEKIGVDFKRPEELPLEGGWK